MNVFVFQVNNNTQNMYVNVIEVFADGGNLRHRLKVVDLVGYFASPQVRNHEPFRSSNNIFNVFITATFDINLWF